MNFLSGVVGYNPNGFGQQSGFVAPEFGQIPEYMQNPVFTPTVPSQVAGFYNPSLGSLSTMPSTAQFPTIGSSPNLRISSQSSEPGLRMPQPSETAPLNTQFGGPKLDMNLLNMGASLLQPPERAPNPQLGLLMPQNRGDFRTLYANYLKEMGLLA